MRVSLANENSSRCLAGCVVIGKRTELFAVKDWLGHKDIKSTMEYVRFGSKQRGSVAEKVYSEDA